MAEVQRFVAPASPIDAIINGLKVAEGAYGIKGAAAKAAALEQDTQNKATNFAQQQQNIKALQDPDSQETKQMQGLGGALHNMLGLKDGDPNSAALHDSLTKGTGYQITNFIQNSPILKDIVQTHSADLKNQALMNMLGTRMGATNSNQAQRAIDKDTVLNTYIPRLDGAAKILSLMDAAQKGDIKSNQAMLGQLNAEISKLETGSSNPALGASERTEMKDSAARFHDVLDTLTGNVTGVDLSQKFNQARGMINDLAKSYMSQIKDRADFLKAGAQPDQQGVYDAKINQISNTYSRRLPGLFGNSNPSSSNGIPQASPSAINKNSSASGDVAQDPKVSKYAADHGLDYGSALSILKKRGYGGS